MMEGNVADLLHPVREHGIASRCKNGYSSQHQILAKGHLGSGFKVSEFQGFKEGNDFKAEHIETLKRATLKPAVLMP
jgi:hypothetical protein